MLLPTHARGRGADLSDEEFEAVLKVQRGQFAALKPWKRQQLKRSAGLF